MPSRCQSGADEAHLPRRHFVVFFCLVVVVLFFHWFALLAGATVANCVRREPGQGLRRSRRQQTASRGELVNASFDRFFGSLSNGSGWRDARRSA